jgi:photosystem II stability/assembly factor-like uncharacterized protein
MTPSGRLELAVSPVNSNMIFASAEGTSTGVESDLYVSTDAGTTWGLVEMKFLNATVDFLGNTAGEVDSQGFYDNTILCDPFNANIVYVGGVNLFRATLGSQSGSFDAYEIEEENTASFLTLQAFSNIGFDNGRLTVGSEADLVPVEIRFGPGLKQLAHRFLVPANQTSGIPVENYSFSSYVEIPFQVWDTQSNRQLMVSFRDQNRNGIFDLVNEFLTSDGSGALLNSREYIYIHNLAYQTTQHPGIATAGGQENFLMYNLFPALRSGATWTPASLPLSTTITVADAYGNFDNKNPVNQTNLVNGMHPDHHFMTAIITNAANKEYKILLGNDGGVFVSNASTVPGTTQNSWTFKGFGYNTSQFYGADKRPGHDQYIGGMQDNGTRISPATGTIDATSEYAFAIGGDGFDVLWNTRDETLVLGSVYNGNIYRSTNGGTTFNAATSGISESSIFPFFTKLAHSKDFPNRVFTIAADGVYVSQNFGASWKLTSIPEHLVTNSASLLDVEVSRANPNIVWAGSGMNNNTNEERHLFVSTDGGTTFSETNNFSGALLGSITKLASHPTEPNTAYALFSFADRPKILRTTDLGQTWKDLSGFGANTSSNNGFPDVATFCLYVRPDDPSILWAGTEIGIFESLDEGQSWSLIPDFPKVAVWDMKGQDNQVVISTHGRGIWTATLPSAQSDFIGAAKIAAAGMAPREALAIRVMIGIDADSVSVFVDKNLNRTIKNITAGTHDYFIKGLAKGNRNIHLITYESGAPFLSPTVTAPVIDLGTVKTNYSTTFSSASEFSLEELTLQRIHAKQNNLSLKTGSPYKNNSTYSALLTEPIKISATLPKLFYKDIAITEPGHDQVVLQSTKNGLDWTNLIAPYDASFSPEWQTAFNQQDTAKRSAMVMHEITLTDFYNVTDTVLFRWSLTTDAQNTAWGWAMDHLSIQELPVATEVSKTVEALSVFPNPAVNEISIRYYLHERSNVTVRLVDVSGRPVVTRDVGTRNPGSQTAGLDVRAVTPGIYILEVATRRSKETRKILIER